MTADELLSDLFMAAITVSIVATRGERVIAWVALTTWRFEAELVRHAGRRQLSHTARDKKLEAARRHGPAITG